MNQTHTLNAGKMGAATALGFGLFWIMGNVIAIFSQTSIFGMKGLPLHRGASEMMGDGPVYLSGFALTLLAAILVWLVATIYNKIG